MTVRPCLLFLAACGHVVAYAPASLAQKHDLDALYERAAAEGEVSAYLQGPPQVYAEFVNAFEAKYPKLKVRITSGRYDLMPKIDAQIAAGAMEADLAILQTTQDYVRWKRQGALQSFAPADFDLIPAGLKDPDAQFLPVFLVMIGLAYNPMQVSNPEAPRTISDFLKPAFKSKIVSTYPHPLQQHADRRDVRLGDDRKAAAAGHKIRPQPRPGRAGNCEGRAAGHVRSDLAVQQGQLRCARGSADAGLSDHDRNLRQSTTS